MIKIIIVWVLAALFGINSLLVSLRSNFNAGTVILWLCCAFFVVYGIFNKKIDMFCQNGLGRVLKFGFFIGVAVYALLLVFVAVSGYANIARGDESALIVLGAGLRGESVGDVLRRRLEAALKAWQENPQAILVVTGGQGQGESIPEGLAMQRWLLARGVPQENIVVENKSVSTEENILFAKQLLEERGILPSQPVAVVTNAFHCYRAVQYAKKLGFANVRSVPASMGWAAIFPSYTREVLAIIYMWVFRRNI